MLRYFLCASLISIGLIAPLAMPATADARPPVVVVGPVAVDPGFPRHHYRHHHHHFHVLYRASCYEPWRDYGVYGCDDDAYAAARYLRIRGFETRVTVD